jgi:hypothetical protein
MQVPAFDFTQPAQLTVSAGHLTIVAIRAERQQASQTAERGLSTHGSL